MTTRAGSSDTAPPLTEPRLDRRLRCVRWTLLAVGGSWTAFFLVFVPITIFEPIAGDSLPGRLVLWGHGGDEYLAMIVAINLVIGIALLRAARDPLAFGQTIDLCLAINTAHLGTMAVMGMIGHRHHLHLVGDVALGLGSTLVLAVVWLPVRRQQALSH